MSTSSPPDSQRPPPTEGQAELEARLRLLREERVRKSLAALQRDRVAFSRATGAATFVKVIGIAVAVLALWWAWLRLVS